MIGMLVESIIVSFIMGGIIGAITAMHIQQASENRKIPLRVKREQDQSKHQ